MLLEEPPEVLDRPGALSLARARGALALEDVTFGYRSAPPRAPRREPGDRAAGERVGFVGETGAGKTTLLSLLLRFYDPVAGRILLDGVRSARFGPL